MNVEVCLIYSSYSDTGNSSLKYVSSSALYVQCCSHPRVSGSGYWSRWVAMSVRHWTRCLPVVLGGRLSNCGTPPPAVYGTQDRSPDPTAPPRARNCVLDRAGSASRKATSIGSWPRVRPKPHRPSATPERPHEGFAGRARLHPPLSGSTDLTAIRPARGVVQPTLKSRAHSQR